MSVDVVPLVLVVDTDHDARIHLCRELTAAGYRAAGVGTIQIAAGYLGELPAVVVLCLDAMDTRNAKQFVEALPRSATLILAANDTTPSSELGLHNTPILRKPFTVEALMETVVDNARRRQMSF